MAQNYTLMARKNLLKPDETPKYYAVARSGRKVRSRKSANELPNVLLTPKENWKVVSVSSCSKSSMYWRKETSCRWVTWAISV